MEPNEEKQEKKLLADISGNLFFKSKRGFKSHVQIKTQVAEGEKIDIVNLLETLEEAVVDKGGTPEDVFKTTTKPKSQDDAVTETFGAEQEPKKQNSECPNGCGPRPWVPAGVSKTKVDREGKPVKYNGFWGECRTCGYKEKKKW